MSAACHQSQYGLVSGHAYSVIGVDAATQMIIVRNPWGKEQYTGPGSDQDDNGQFEVPLDTFHTSFTHFSILRYEDWQVTSSGMYNANPTSDNNFNIYNDVAQEVILTVDLLPVHMVEPGCEGDFQGTIWTTSGLNAAYDWQAPNTYVSSRSAMSASVVVANLEPGWHTVGFKAQYNDNIQNPNTFAIHAYGLSSPVHIYDGAQNQISTQTSTAYVY